MKSSAVSCGDDEWLLEDFRAPAVTAIGRVKIDLPKYRIRGICRIEFDGGDGLTIDFRHSSLFGAYEEDALIRLRGGELTIIDRERGSWLGTDSSLAIIARGVGFEVYADDLLYALHLVFPACSEMTEIRLLDEGEAWRLVGLWRGREIALEGGNRHVVESFSLCPLSETGCYRMIYRYDGSSAYPNRIAMVRDEGPERITFDIVDRRIGLESSE